MQILALAVFFQGTQFPSLQYCNLKLKNPSVSKLFRICYPEENTIRICNPVSTVTFLEYFTLQTAPQANTKLLALQLFKMTESLGYQ